MLYHSATCGYSNRALAKRLSTNTRAATILYVPVHEQGRSHTFFTLTYASCRSRVYALYMCSKLRLVNNIFICTRTYSHAFILCMRVHVGCISRVSSHLDGPHPVATCCIPDLNSSKRVITDNIMRHFSKPAKWYS
jgi:hypothetical protein